jgi:hypothetical protein
MTSTFFKIIPFLMLVFSLAGCTKEDDDNTETRLLGLWMLNSKTIDGSGVSLSDCEKRSSVNLQEFNLCILYDGCSETSQNSGWSYKHEMLNIALHFPAAYYIDELTTQSLVLSRQDITDQGQLQVTVLSYSKQIAVQ